MHAPPALAAQPGELAQRLRGEYQPSDSEEEEMSVADPSASEIEVTLVGGACYLPTAARQPAPRSCLPA